MGPDEWAGFIVPHFYMGPVPAFFYAAGQLMDYAVHSWDIRQGSGRAHGLSGDAADLLVPFMFVLWQSTIRQDADLTPFRLGITVTGRNAGSYRIDVSDEGMSYEQGDLERPAHRDRLRRGKPGADHLRPEQRRDRARRSGDRRPLPEPVLPDLGIASSWQPVRRVQSASYSSAG